MVAERECARDAVGQLVWVGDLVGGVRLGQYPVTVGGQVTALGERQVKVRVHLVTDTGDHERRRDTRRERQRPALGSEVWVYNERLFKVDALFIDEEVESDHE